MKRQTQKTGVRTYFGDDLVDLQTQPLNAIDAMLAAAGQCVISGCEVTPQGDKYDVAPGYVALEAADEATGAVRIMAMPFGGVSGVTLPVYLMASVDVVERAYGDGAVKPIAYAYNAIASAVKPLAAPSIEITANYTRGLSDALAESLAKYIAVTATEKATWSGKETPAGAQTKADAAKTEAVATAKTYTDGAIAGKANAKHSHGIATAATDGFMAKGDKSKLDGVATGANNYTHPADVNTRHVTDAEKTAWSGKASSAVATTSANGLMSRGDKARIDATGLIAYGTVYSSGGVSLGYGNCTAIRTSTGNYTVEYGRKGFAIAVPHDIYNPGSRIGCQARGDTSCYVSTQVDGVTADSAFTIMVYGVG